jgi:hypothetical protein
MPKVDLDTHIQLMSSGSHKSQTISHRGVKLTMGLPVSWIVGTGFTIGDRLAQRLWSTLKLRSSCLLSRRKNFASRLATVEGGVASVLATFQFFYSVESMSIIEAFQFE